MRFKNYASVKTILHEQLMDEFGRPLEKEQVVMLVPHYGAPFEDTMVFTSLEKAMKVWSFLENRDCVEVRKLTLDVELDAWI